MAPFWDVDRNRATAAANRGDMTEVMRVIAGKASTAGLDAIWTTIHGDQQMADFQRFRKLLET